MTKEELQRLRNWAEAKIAAGQEPPWAWYQFMKLREAVDAIIGEMECVAIEKENSALSWQFEVQVPRLVVNNTLSEPIHTADALHTDELLVSTK
jgi:hypothetical protein